MNFETILGLAIALVIAILVVIKLFKLSKPSDDGDDYENIKPYFKWLAWVIIVAVAVVSLVILQHMKVIHIPTGSPAAGSELPNRSAAPVVQSVPVVEVNIPKVTIESAAEDHDKALEKFKKQIEDKSPE